LIFKVKIAYFRVESARHDITEILLKVALSTINHKPNQSLNSNQEKRVQ
jgi:hypothetical protein